VGYNKIVFLTFFIMNIYVGNLNYKVNGDRLKTIFGEFGEVSSAVVITDKFTGKSKGFGFVTMDNDDDAQRAIAELNGKEFDGRQMVVNEARPREDNR
jgi:RNA recognition motif-containing protein